MIRSRKAWTLSSTVVVLVLAGTKAENLSAWAGSDQDPAAKAPAAQPTEVTLKPIKYQQLMEAVKAEHGNIVVVDVWATYCVPCKKEFPNFVKLHERRAKDGVVCISVSVDKKDDVDQALAWLKKQKATSTNYWLDEPGDVWAKKWKVKAVPVAFVFDRQGRIAKKFDNDNGKPDGFSYDEVNKVVDDLLKPGF